MIKKIVIALLVSTCVLTGCTTPKEISDKMEEFHDGDYFVTISNERYGMIVYDSRTKVQYWISTPAYNYGNLTLLVDSEGKPLIYKGE